MLFPSNPWQQSHSAKMIISKFFNNSNLSIYARIYQSANCRHQVACVAVVIPLCSSERFANCHWWTLRRRDESEAVFRFTFVALPLQHNRILGLRVCTQSVSVLRRGGGPPHETGTTVISRYCCPRTINAPVTAPLKPCCKFLGWWNHMQVPHCNRTSTQPQGNQKTR